LTEIGIVTYAVPVSQVVLFPSHTNLLKIYLQDDKPGTFRCLCGELNPTARHYISCFYCTTCGRWAHGRGQHNKTCQTSKRGNREPNPNKKCCPYCGDWIHKTSFARHIKNKHPKKYQKRVPKNDTPSRRSVKSEVKEDEQEVKSKVEKDEHDVKSNAKKDKPDIKSNDEVKSKEKVKDAAKSSKKRSRASLKSEEQMSPTKPARKKSSSRPALRAEEEPPADVTPPPRLEDNDDEPPAQVTPTPQARSEPANDEEPPAEVTPPPRQSFWQNRFMVISNIYNILLRFYSFPLALK
jgi:hypothetical protein